MHDTYCSSLHSYSILMLYGFDVVQRIHYYLLGFIVIEVVTLCYYKYR